MPTESLVRQRVVALLLVLITAWSGASLAAERVDVGPQTEVRNLRFRGVHSLQVAELRRVLQTRERASFYGLRNVIGKLPLIPSPPKFKFEPRVLQLDVARLRRAYERSGFRGTYIYYEVERVGSDDLLDITFVVEEGIPQRLVDVSVAPAGDRTELPVPSGASGSWAKEKARASKLAGRRIDMDAVVDQRNRMERWWWDRGFPEASIRLDADRDSVHNEVRIVFRVNPGVLSRFGDIRVEGNESISDRVVHRGLGFESGDTYSEDALLGARRGLQQLQIVRAARLDADRRRNDDSSAVVAADSVVPVLVTIAEAKPRLVSGQVGYVTDGGISTEASWTHRNFTGGARVFTVSGLAQTGWLAISRDPDVRYRGSVSLQQPQLFHRLASGIVSPFIEYREDLQARGLEIGSNFTLIYRIHDRVSGSLDYRIATRRIYEYKLDDLASGDIDLVTFLTQVLQGQIDSLGARSSSSLLTLSATGSALDNITNPRLGLLIRPTVQVTAPPSWSSLNYWRTDASAYGFLPVAPRTTFASRISAGRIFPFGRSVPDEDLSVNTSLLQLREVSFTAGGSQDVRGWDYRMLGPKLPDLRFQQEGDSIVLRADGYVPEGGLTRVSFSLELRLPFPGLGPNIGTHVFLDGGRVWSEDSRFEQGEDTFGQDRYFYGTGAGIDLLSPVGSVKFGLGYKLNPSVLDLANSGDVLQALLDGRSLDTVEQRQSRRWAFYFALGSSF